MQPFQFTTCLGVVAQHMLRVVQHMCDSVRLKLSQPSLAGVGAGAELGNFLLLCLEPPPLHSSQ